jgi:hypothetical protein
MHHYQTHWSISRTFAPYPLRIGNGMHRYHRGIKRGIGLRVHFNEMGWIESAPGPTKLCGSTLPPLFAEGIREPWMLACSISAIQVVLTSINWHWDPRTGGRWWTELLLWLPKILCMCIPPNLDTPLLCIPTIGALTGQSGSVLQCSFTVPTPQKFPGQTFMQLN